MFIWLAFSDLGFRFAVGVQAVRKKYMFNNKR